MPTPRDIAFQTLLPWQRMYDPPFLPERTDAAWEGLSPRDRAFAFDLVTGVMRWRNTLDAVIQYPLRQPLDSLDHAVRVVLWIGAYQLLMQSGTADYAAVDTTVELAKKQRSTVKAAGLVNAVLRGITRLKPTRGARLAGRLGRNVFALDFETDVTLSADVFPAVSAPDAHLAAVRSHPAIYVQHVRKIFGDVQAGEILLRNNVRPVVTLRVDAAAIDVPANAGLAPHAEAKQFLVASEGWNPVIEDLVQRGVVSPQDPTSAKPVRALAELAAAGKIREPGTILDLCAGLGTKAIQLARTFPGARITATDLDSQKTERLRKRAAQMGISNLSVVPMAEVASGKPFDAVLLDVPCSNTGVMAKRVQSRWRWPSLGGEGFAALKKLQSDLLAQGSSLAGANGAVVYATCSIDPAENEMLVQEFIKGSTRKCGIVEQESTVPSLSNSAVGMRDGGHYTVIVAE
ncbi:MAG TPA: transcription antitermination factor NusB [Phycisphaerae bacterium]|nr:transcription antitermination factor NusB [Phycisphaerae bacterium]